MLQTKNLTKVYKKKHAETVALDNVNIDFGDKGLIFVVGKSGSGKSTLLNLLGGLLRPTDGDVIINGQSGVEFSEGKLDNYRNSAVGFVFQEYNLFENSTVGANVKLALELQGKNADREVVEEILRKVELCDEDGKTYYDRRVNMLSGGQRQRVAIARALIKEPEIILADEPTGALDTDTGEEVFNLLKEISKQKLVIVVSHDRHSAQKFGDRVIELADGKIISDSNENYSGTNNGTVKEKKYTASKFPVKYALVTGVSSLKTNTFRLVLSVIISVMCLIVFGFLLASNFCDELKTELKTMYSEKSNMAVVWCGKKLPLDELTKLLDENGVKSANAELYATVIDIGTNLNLNHDEIIKKENPYFSLACYNNDWVAELNPETGEEVAKLTPDSRFIDKSLCRLPREYDEIAITDIKADLFIKYGYMSDEGEVIKITTPDDLIGKTITNRSMYPNNPKSFKICGVYSTEQSADYFRHYDVENYGLTSEQVAMGYTYELEEPAHTYFQSARNSIITFNFVCEGFFENSYENFEGFYCKLVQLSGNYSKDYALLNKIGKLVDDYSSHNFMQTSVTSFLYPVYFFNDLKPYTFPAACAIGAFALLVTLNFLIASVGDRNKEMCILRSLGAGKRSIIFVCIVESLMLALINFILSVAGTAVVCAIMNAVYYAKVFSVGIETVSLLLLISIAFSVISTAVLSLIMTHKKNT